MINYLLAVLGVIGIGFAFLIILAGVMMLLDRFMNWRSKDDSY